MMNYRHLNEQERQALKAICRETGEVEVLRTLAAMIAFDHPDLTEGSDLRYELNLIAKRLNDFDPEPRP